MALITSDCVPLQAFGAMARTLEALPASRASDHVEYSSKLVKMAAKLKTLQGADGCWRSSLEDKDEFPQIETTGTSLIVFGMSYGVNAGLLPKVEYSNAAVKGWACLNQPAPVGAVADDGRLGWCQPGGASPEGNFNSSTTSDFCVGTFLLAGSEVAKLVRSAEGTELKLSGDVFGFIKSDARGPPLKLDDDLGKAAAAAGDENRWAYAVGSPFPSVWFGGSPWHSDVPNLRSNHVINYSSAYFGWQSMNAVPAPVGGCHHEEALLREQTAAVKAMAPQVKTLAYIGNGASCLCFYDAQDELCQNPAKFSGFFLPDTTKQVEDSGQRSAIGGGGANCPTSKLTFDFRNASMVDFFVNKIVGPWAGA